MLHLQNSSKGTRSSSAGVLPYLPLLTSSSIIAPASTPAFHFFLSHVDFFVFDRNAMSSPTQRERARLAFVSACNVLVLVPSDPIG